MITDTLFIVSAYLLGSLSSAVITCKLMGLPDPRSQGSKNPGATNVLRFGGKKAAIFSLLGDVLKGLLPVMLAIQMGSPPWVTALVGIASFCGHIYPVFFGFQGGKGVATAFGVALGISGWVGLAALATWLFTAIIFRISSLAGLTAAVLSPIYIWYITQTSQYSIMMIFISLILVVRHHSNIQNLLKGIEPKIGKKKQG